MAARGGVWAVALAFLGATSCDGFVAGGLRLSLRPVRSARGGVRWAMKGMDDPSERVKLKTTTRYRAQNSLAHTDLEAGAAALTTPKGVTSRTQTKPVEPIVGTRPSMFSDVPQTSGLTQFVMPTLLALDIEMVLLFALWYVGNYYHNVSNKLALMAVGGASGFPITIATLQLAIGSAYAVFMWIAPDGRPRPTTTVTDVVSLMPLSFFAACAHVFSVFALSAGALSFGQIVKAAEPAFAAVLGTLFYRKRVSLGRWLCLVPVIGGAVIASVAEPSFGWACLAAASTANVFSSLRANENERVMSTKGLKERVGSVGNQFAFTTVFSFLFLLPLAVFAEGKRWGMFMEMCLTREGVVVNLLASGLWFYAYNEAATSTIKKTNAITQSVANTAKRVILIVLAAAVLGESLHPVKMLGCSIGIAGVFAYSVIDMFWKPKVCMEVNGKTICRRVKVPKKIDEWSTLY